MISKTSSIATNNPEISVVVPAHNAGCYLAECLQSILGQTFEDIEVIVVDDGSEDGTAQIAGEFVQRDGRVRLIRCEHFGPGFSRNTGIEAASGRYVLFVDADDVLMCNALESLHAVARDSGIDYVVGGMLRGEHLPPGAAGREPSRRVQILPAQEAVRKILYQKLDATSACGVLFGRHLFRNNLFYNGFYEDLNLTYRLMLEAGKVAVVKDRIYFYRQHPSSFIHTFSRARLDALDVTDSIVEYMAEHLPEALKAAEDRQFSAHCNVYALLCKMWHEADVILGSAEREAVEHRCLGVIRRRRMAEILDPEVRFKNKLGAVVSFIPPFFKLIARL